eukprot:sb/3477550/
MGISKDHSGAKSPTISTHTHSSLVQQLISIVKRAPVSAAGSGNNNREGAKGLYRVGQKYQQNKLIQSDPHLVTSSGERVLVTKSGWALNRGQIPLISFYPVTKSGCH